MPELASHGAEVEPTPDIDREPRPREALLTRARSGVRVVPGAVWAITAAYLALLVCYSLLYPVYLGFDEPQHVDMTIALRHDPLDWPGPGERKLSAAIASTQGIVYSRGRPRITESYVSAEIAPRGERKTIQELGDNAPVATPPALPNQMVQHPPLYYAIGAAVLGVLPFSESLTYDQVVGLLRWLSVLMIAPLPLLVWGATKQLVGPGPIAIAASALPLAVPGLARGAGNVQNDNLLILVAAVLTLLLAKVMAGDVTRRTAVYVGVAMSLALLTKGTALPLTILIPLAYAVAWWRRRERAPLFPAVVACGIGAIGGLWWVRNLIVYGTVQINGYGVHSARLEELQGGKPGPHDVDVWWGRFNDWYESRFWSGLGLLDQNGLSLRLYRSLTILALIGVVLALVYGFGRGRGDRPAVVVLALPVLLITGVVVYGALSEFLRTGISGGIQGRYAYPAVPGLAAVVAIGYGRAAGRFAKYLPAVAFLGALAVQVVAVRGVLFGLWLPRPWTGGGRAARYEEAFGNLAAWSPWPIGVTYTAFVVAAVLMTIALVAFVLPRPAASLRHRLRPGRDVRAAEAAG